MTVSEEIKTKHHSQGPKSHIRWSLCAPCSRRHHTITRHHPLTDRGRIRQGPRTRRRRPSRIPSRVSCRTPFHPRAYPCRLSTRPRIRQRGANCACYGNGGRGTYGREDAPAGAGAAVVRGAGAVGGVGGDGGGGDGLRRQSGGWGGDGEAGGAVGEGGGCGAGRGG